MLQTACSLNPSFNLKRNKTMFRYSIIKVRLKDKMSLYKGTSGRSISRILSSGSLRLCSHLSGQCVAALLDATYPGLCGDEQSPIVRRRFRPCLALLPAGVTWPSALLQMPVVSYTTFSPSPLHPKGWKGCLFLWPCSGRFTPLGGFPAPGAIRRRALWSADFPRS
jgi:hypothetical protein